MALQLIAAGRTVVAAARDANKGDSVFQERGLQRGHQADRDQVRPKTHVFTTTPCLFLMAVADKIVQDGSIGSFCNMSGVLIICFIASCRLWIISSLSLCED